MSKNATLVCQFEIWCYELIRKIRGSKLLFNEIGYLIDSLSNILEWYSSFLYGSPFLFYDLHFLFSFLTRILLSKICFEISHNIINCIIDNTIIPDFTSVLVCLFTYLIKSLSLISVFFQSWYWSIVSRMNVHWSSVLIG